MASQGAKASGKRVFFVRKAFTVNGIDWRGGAIALGAGFSGALAALWVGLPAAALLGSTAAVTAASFAGLRPTVPAVLRDVGFCIIGISLGSGVTPQIWEDLARWPASILILAVTVLAVMILCAQVLRFFFRTDMATALLATSPGALSYTLSLAADRDADVRFVIVMQSLRLLLITILLPPVIGYAEGLDGGAAAHGMPHLPLLVASGLCVATFALGAVMERFRSPAPFVLAGLLVSGFFHGTGMIEGRPADLVTFFGFTVTGAVIGARFAGITLDELRRLSLAGLVSTALAIAVAMTGAFLTARLMNLPFGQVWVSFAPGGVEGMSSMALALGYDPVYVATHHVFRILLLIAILPVLMGFFAGRVRRLGK